MTLSDYISELDRQYRTGLAREHSYRPALQQLLATLLPNLTVTNEPARIACGAPDFIVTRKSDALPVAFLEAKDIDDNDLDGKRQHREQFERYNIALQTIRINRDLANTVCVSSNITDKTFLSSKDNVTIFPLYVKDANVGGATLLSPNNNNGNLFNDKAALTPNFRPDIVSR